MSILIKGIDMPKTCEECEVWSLCHYPKVPKGIGRREPDCPLIEIPTPHGRLIDGDGLKDTLKEYCIDDDEKVAEWYRIMGIDEAIDDNAPTVLEAEE